MAKGNMSERIARIIENDAGGEIKRTLRVVQSDVAALLGEFMQINSLDMTVDRAEKGYTLKITADVDRFYGVGNTTENE